MAPSPTDFLAVFGIEPVEVDATMSYEKYRVFDKARVLELEFSFSEVQNSFQIAMNQESDNIFIFSSECVTSVDIFDEKGVSGFRVNCNFSSAKLEVIVELKPTINCRSSVLRVR